MWANSCSQFHQNSASDVTDSDWKNTLEIMQQEFGSVTHPSSPYPFTCSEDGSPALAEAFGSLKRGFRSVITTIPPSYMVRNKTAGSINKNNVKRVLDVDNHYTPTHSLYIHMYIHIYIYGALL